MAKQAVSLEGKTILVTGSPGFIGANLVMRLLGEVGDGTVVSLDNMNDYYDPSLKEYRLGLIEEAAQESAARHVFVRGSIADRELVERVFSEYEPDVVVNLAAQAGVRYSIDHPDVYIESNIVGFYNILEACRAHPVEHLVYASSSSVYGGNKKVPFSVDDKVDNPVSLYAATKKSNELLAHSYSKLYDIPSTGLRFFTVYGPAGRPDMFYFSATKRLVAGGTIKSSTTATAGATSPTWTILWRASRACCAGPPRGAWARTGSRSLRMPCTTSAAASPRTCLTSCPRCRRSSCAQACCPRATTSRRTASWSACSPATCS